jgi:hypothetical protein
MICCTVVVYYKDRIGFAVFEIIPIEAVIGQIFFCGGRGGRSRGRGLFLGEGIRD